MQLVVDRCFKLGYYGNSFATEGAWPPRSYDLSKQIHQEDIEGHWFCKKQTDHDIDHGPCIGYQIEELGITIYTYANDHTRISIHRETGAA